MFRYKGSIIPTISLFYKYKNDVDIFIEEYLNTADENNPLRIVLMNREHNADGEWFVDSVAGSINSGNDIASFKQIPTGQLMLIRNIYPHINQISPEDNLSDIIPVNELSISFLDDIFLGNGYVYIYINRMDLYSNQFLQILQL